MKTFERFIQDKPIRTHYPNGNVEEEKWYDEDANLHRETGPAQIEYYENGNISSEFWFIHGYPHRECGPSDIYYNENGELEDEEYYLDGERYSFEDWLEKLKVINPEQYEIWKKKKEFKDLGI